ncbi:PspC domain-containing protein [Terrabacter sp. 2RAF25]|uniref:PspC domain-containing protein n=1 Tax=Terrabacter sp. 2RAF25 TaxID=3232998 RepID=UPI003F97756A
MTKSNGAPTQGHGLDGFYTALRRPGIVRNRDGRWFAGVATGVARWLGVDPLVVRAGFILFSIFFGMGVALYLVLWLLMPDERGEIHIERALKHGEGSSIFLLVVTGISVLGGGPWWGGDTQGFRFFGFALLVGGAWWFLTRTDTGRDVMAQAPWKNGGNRPATGSTATADPSAPADPATPGTTTPSGAPLPAYGSTGNAAANAGATMTTPRPPAPTPVRQRTPSIGFAGGLLVLGLAITTGVVFSIVAEGAGWPGNHVAIGIASGVGMLGLAIVVAGIAGRRSGLGFFAVVGVIAAALTTAAPAGLDVPWQVGDQSYAVTSLTPAPTYKLGMGDLKVDLTRADYKAPGTDTVTATLGAGNLTIVVPKGVPVTVNTKARAGALDAKGTNEGEVTRDSGDHDLQAGGISWTRTVHYGPTTGPDEIVVDAEVGLGQIQVLTGSAS